MNPVSPGLVSLPVPCAYPFINVPSRRLKSSANVFSPSPLGTPSWNWPLYLSPEGQRIFPLPYGTSSSYHSILDLCYFLTFTTSPVYRAPSGKTCLVTISFYPVKIDPSVPGSIDRWKLLSEISDYFMSRLRSRIPLKLAWILTTHRSSNKWSTSLISLTSILV